MSRPEISDAQFKSALRLRCLAALRARRRRARTRRWLAVAALLALLFGSLWLARDDASPVTPAPTPPPWLAATRPLHPGHLVTPTARVERVAPRAPVARIETPAVVETVEARAAVAVVGRRVAARIEERPVALLATDDLLELLPGRQALVAGHTLVVFEAEGARRFQ